MEAKNEFVGHIEPHTYMIEKVVSFQDGVQSQFVDALKRKTKKTVAPPSPPKFNEISSIVYVNHTKIVAFEFDDIARGS